MFTQDLSALLCGISWFALSFLSISPGRALLHSGNSSSPSQCGGVLRAGSGVISSPIQPAGVPSRYPDNLRCGWTIVTPKSRRVRLVFSTFDLQFSDHCQADYVKIIQDGESETASSTVYCGRDQALPPPVLSTGSVLRVLFVTDGSLGGAGFSVFYQSVRVDAPDAPVIVWLEQNLADSMAKLQTLPADPADYLSSGSIVTNTMLKYRPANWSALAVDYHNRDFFWSDPKLKLVWHGEMSGDTLVAEPLYSGTSSAVAGLAVDWLARTVYWTDAAYNWIMVSNYDGSRHRVLVEDGLDEPSGIVVHPSQGWLFWADQGSKSRIERSRLDGQDRRVLIGAEAGYPVGITVDYPHDRLYWTAHGPTGTSSIFSASIDGESLMEHVRVDYNQYVFNDLTIFKEYLYVTDSTNQLHCYQKDAGMAHYFSFNLGVRRPFGITSFADNNYVFESSWCDRNPCEYLCVSTDEHRHRCLCQLGYHAVEDGTCVRDSDVQIPPPKLFVVARDSICMYPDNVADMPLSGAGGTGPGQCILRDLPEATAMTTDVQDSRLFYSLLGEGGTLYSVRLRNNENVVTVVGGTGAVHGMAVDWLAKLLYWTDSLLNHIAMATYDGRHRKILLRDDMDQPGSIALDPHERFIFWTYLTSGASQLERAGLDGSSRIVILREVMEPRGIALDYNSKRLYLAERGTGTIRTFDYSGRDWRTVYAKREAMFTGLALYKDYLFWTQWNPAELHAVNRKTGKLERKLPLSGVAESPYGVAMYAESRQPLGQSPCSNSSHGCQQLCLPAPLPSDFVCDCAIGYTLGEDGSSCTSDLVKDNFILVTDTVLHGIYQVDLSTPDPTLQALPLTNVSNPLSVGYDPLLGMVYWSDVTKGTISRASLAGGNQEVIVTSNHGEAPYSIVVDSRLLFWTDVESNSIKVCRLDGAYQMTLVNTSASPRALTTFANEGLLFWTWWGEDSAGISKSSMDGRNVEVLLSNNGGFLHGLAVDALERRLYWTDADVHTIESIDLDTGSDRQTTPLGFASRPFGLAVEVSHILWTDQGSRRLMRADRATGTNVEIVGSLDLARPNGMHCQARSSNSVVNNGCSLSNGGCSGLCLPTPTGRTCACADGVAADEDGSCPFGEEDKSVDKVTQLEFINRPHDLTLEVGMEINQMCSSNQPSASVKWQKDFMPLPLGQTGGIYVLSDGALVILDVDETHRGFYTCTITGTTGDVIEASAEFQFSPQEVFEMTPELAVIQEGEDYILTCSARPASYVIRWEKDGAPVQLSDMVHVISGDSLIIREAVVSDSGKYTCIAQTLGGVRVAEVTARVTVTAQQAVQEVCGTVTSPEALGLSEVGSEGAEEEEDRTFRIVGGTTAKRGSSPWIVRLWVNEDRTHFCGGALLNRYWVLTGAHCITEYSLGREDIKIRLGDHDSYSDEGSERLVGVQHIKVHDEFVDSDYDGDLALVKLAEPVERFTDYLRPLCLPSKALARELLKPGRKGKVAGWGRLVEGGPFPRYLTEVDVPIVGQQKCIRSTTYLVTERMFCAGYKKKKGDACRGDSGGPFSIEHEGRWYQLGIVSWGEGCGREGKYGFYTRLVKFLQWINQYMEEH
ncbi:low-density lipoprotein receptor-related protein 4-like [Acanthaster planci]|uniref:Low-density lipoprotein receptor-related protein 4-like n=1 Tax=Acanthaster planci TaxID=133434 RepID=A0A8B7ZUD1_ACAPL|nr:low-density lipoprotein receptor-related protein 4-like [Acanthaster planci]